MRGMTASGNKYVQYSNGQAVIYPGLEMFISTSGGTNGNGVINVISSGDSSSPISNTC
jgi:hypothetical protein